MHVDEQVCVMPLDITANNLKMKMTKPLFVRPKRPSSPLPLIDHWAFLNQLISYLLLLGPLKYLVVLTLRTVFKTEQTQLLVVNQQN